MTSALLALPALGAWAAEVDSPILSGLGWRSGASCADAAFEGWRGGRKLDVTVSFISHDTWQQMLNAFKSNYFKTYVRNSPQVVVSLAMMPRAAKKQHAACAQGQFDSYFKQFGTLMTKAGAGQAVVRLGWEANIGSRYHPWGIDTAEDVADYVACFKREVAALRSTAPGIKVEWTSAKKGYLPFPVLDSYPGDDVVDLWGLNFYDRNPRMRTQAIWDDFYNARDKGSPWGLGPWLEEAAKHGRKVAISEWGVWDEGVGPAKADDPNYIANMYKFFKTHAGSIAYENYYNCPKSTKIHPTTTLPKSSAMYQQLWSAGQ